MPNQKRLELRKAIVELRERGLYDTVSWAADLMAGNPPHKDPCPSPETYVAKQLKNKSKENGQACNSSKKGSFSSNEVNSVSYDENWCNAFQLKLPLDLSVLICSHGMCISYRSAKSCIRRRGRSWGI